MSIQLLREARQQTLGIGKEHAGKLQQGEMDVWSFTGKAGDFRVFEVEKRGDVQARLILDQVNSPPLGEGNF